MFTFTDLGTIPLIKLRQISLSCAVYMANFN